MRSVFLFILLTALFPVCGFDAVVDGVPNATVYVAEESIPAEKKAASELVAYLEKISGAKLPVTSTLPEKGNRIIVGGGDEVQKFLKDIDLKKLRPDEIILVSPDENTLVLSGDRPRGALYAVYTFLENLGVRFWGTDYEFIPQKRSIAIPATSLVYAPPFEFRESFSESRYASMEWYVKLKLNGDFALPKIPEEYGGNFTLDIQQNLIGLYVKPKEFFETHPEWFAWSKKENRRVPKSLCMTNEEMLKQLTEEVRRDLKADPSRKFVSVALPDNGTCCECENCTRLTQKEESYSAASVYVANYVAKAIRSEFPQVRVMTLAYWQTQRPPKSMKMEKNTGIGFAFLDRNHGLPPSAAPSHNPFLKKWMRLSHGNLYIWDYYATFGNFLLPMPNLYVMQSAIRTYRDFHVKGVTAQLPFGSIAEFEELRTYLLAKLCWNPDLNIKYLIQEYLDGVCGKAAPYIQQYIDLLEKAKNRKPVWIGVYSEKTDHWLQPADILKGRELFRNALAAVADTPDVQKRVRRLSATVVLVSCLRYADIADEAAKRKQELPSYSALVDELEALGKEFRCNNYKEWAPFSELIERLRKNPPTPKETKKASQTTRILGAGEFQGSAMKVIESPDGDGCFARLAVDSGKMCYPFLEMDKGCIFYELPESLAGKWNVQLDIRVDATEDQQVDAAYLGIYAPNEICRQEFSVPRDDSAWRTVCLGTWELPARSRIWIMPGVTAPTNFIDVRAITLLPAAN